ncbi:ATPase AAA [Candidatus Magnetomorum sp. HK-1]|nr:ATPase AAA [Candidatus Magnetomorum sp. HK-1]
METNQSIKFPYGICDFKSIIKENYVYLDRTKYISQIENMGKSILFLRPRRFGKSLFLDTMQNYYDIAMKDEFNNLYGRLDIGKNPTDLHNQYFVLTLDFSCVQTEGGVDKIERSLYNHINATIQQFNEKYQTALKKTINVKNDNSMWSFYSLLSCVLSTPYKLYLMIDEYDSFANSVLVSGGQTEYKSLVGQNGLLRYIFREFKSATRGKGVDRIFATGVSPVVMSDVSSGANILQNRSQAIQLNNLCGLTHDEVKLLLGQTCGACQFSESKYQEALEMMERWYEGYSFDLSQHESLYNPTLCFYFFQHLKELCTYPRIILDDNLAPDEEKLVFIKTMPGGEEILWQLIEGKNIYIPEIVRNFGLKKMLNAADQDNSFIAAYLWYGGVLSVKGETKKGKLLLNVPNLVIKKLYIEQSRSKLLPSAQLKNIADDVSSQLYENLNMAPLAQFVENKVLPIFSNRDYKYANELTIKTIFLTLLHQDTLFMVASEQEHRRGYADLAMIVRPDCRKYELFDMVIEFKYLSLKDLGMTGVELSQKATDELIKLEVVRKMLDDAKKQAIRYATSIADEFRISDEQIKKWAVVGLGFERLVWEMMD